MSYIKLYSFDENSLDFHTFKVFKNPYLDINNNISQYSHIPYLFNISKDRFTTIQTSNFYKYLNKDLSLDISNLNPIATRYIGDTYKYVERPPFKASVKYKEKNSSTSFNFSLWIPWTLFVSTFQKGSENCSIYFSSRQLSSTDDLYLSSCYPNIFDDARICFGNSFYNYISNIESHFTSSTLSSYINYFFSGTWNDDIGPVAPSFIFEAVESEIIYSHELLSNFPLINKYVTFDRDFISSRLSSINSQSLNDTFSHILQNYLFQDDNYIYYLFFLSLLDLEETLIFFEELTDFTSLILSKNSSNTLEYRPPLSSFKEIISSYEPTCNQSTVHNNYFAFAQSIINNIFVPNSPEIYSTLNPSNHYMVSDSLSIHFLMLQDVSSASSDLLSDSFYPGQYYSANISTILQSKKFLSFFHNLWNYNFYLDKSIPSLSDLTILVFIHFDGNNFSLISSNVISKHYKTKDYSYSSSQNFHSSVWDDLKKSISSYYSEHKIIEDNFNSFTEFFLQKFNKESLNV